MKYRGVILFFTGLLGSLGAGWFGFPRVLYEQKRQPLQFSHKTHTGAKAGMKCEDCHAIREDGGFAGIPAVSQCGTCHAAAMTSSADEKLLVEKYVASGQEIGWLVYARQPGNVYFSHAVHAKRAKLACERCHGGHGATENLRRYERNRISGYSRDIWGRDITRLHQPAGSGMKMSDCEKCHEENRVTSSCLTCHK